MYQVFNDNDSKAVLRPIPIGLMCRRIIGLMCSYILMVRHYSCEGTTQGYPLAMAMYDICILPLVKQLNLLSATQIWYADDATAGGKVDHVYEWWTSLNTIGPSYGYHANPAKTWLIVKEEYLSPVKELFAPAGVNITTDGKRHLSDIARTQPHAAHSAFTCGLSCQWSYLSRTIPDIADLFTPLDNVINTHFIPTLTGHDSINDVERRLLALPPRLGGLGLTIPSKGIYFL